MKVVYQFIVESLFNEQLGYYDSCTITVIASDGKILEQVQDAFINPIDADRFVEKCNKHQLMPVHLKDVLLGSIP